MTFVEIQFWMDVIGTILAILFGVKALIAFWQDDRQSLALWVALAAFCKT